MLFGWPPGTLQHAPKSSFVQLLKYNVFTQELWVTIDGFPYPYKRVPMFLAAGLFSASQQSWLHDPRTGTFDSVGMAYNAFVKGNPSFDVRIP